MTESNNQSAAIPYKIGPGSEPLVTGDGVIAFALYMAGTPFCDEALWCVNYYTPDILIRLGYKGVPMREAATRAVKEGQPGIIRFLLQKPEPGVLEAYQQQVSEIQTGEGLGPVVFKRLLDDYKSGALEFGEAATRIVCLLLKMRIQFMNGWKEMVPLLRIDSGKAHSQPQVGMDGMVTVELGGFKFISANASEAVRQHMDL